MHSIEKPGGATRRRRGVPGADLVRRISSRLAALGRRRKRGQALDLLMSHPHLARDIGAHDARKRREPDQMRPGFREGHL